MRQIPDPGFAGDSGAASPEVTDALAAYADGTGSYAAALAALAGARLLVPVVAVLGDSVLGDSEVGADGLTREKSADMAAVLMTSAEGRLGLLAFTSTAAMAAWDPQARPVPVPAPTAALAAVQEQAAAVVVDIAGPVRFVVEDDALRALGAAASRPGELDSPSAGMFD